MVRLCGYDWGLSLLYYVAFAFVLIYMLGGAGVVTLLPLLSIRHAIPYVIMAVVSLSYWMGGGSCSLTLCSSAIVHCSRVGRRRELMNLLRSWPSELTRGGWGTPRPGASWWG